MVENVIEVEEPDMLIMSPVCGPLSRTQTLTPFGKRRNQEEGLLSEVEEAKRMVTWCCRLAQKQAKKGRRFIMPCSSLAPQCFSILSLLDCWRAPN